MAERYLKLRERFTTRKQKQETNENKPDNDPGRGKTFSFGESVRLLHVIADPSNLDVVRKMCQGITAKSELDLGYHRKEAFYEEEPATPTQPAKPAGPFWMAFHNKENVYEVPDYDPLQFPLLESGKKFVTPNEFVARKGSTLYNKWLEFRKFYGIAWNNYNTSGRNGKEFFHFALGRPIVEYMHLLCQDNSLLHSTLIRKIEGASTSEDDHPQTPQQLRLPAPKTIKKESAESSFVDLCTTLKTSLVPSPMLPLSSHFPPPSPTPSHIEDELKRKRTSDRLRQLEEEIFEVAGRITRLPESCDDIRPLLQAHLRRLKKELAEEINSH